MTGLDGSTGRVLWTYKAPRWEDATLLDPGDSGRMPRVVSAGLYSGRTVCRQVLPATPGGDCQRPSGSLVPAGLVPDDPRWTRPLPWTGPVRRVTAPSWVFALVGLALVNVVLPIAMLRLAARRRPWTLRLLMMLPVAAAVPLCAYLAVEPLMPAQVDPLPPYPKLLFALATIAGIPVVIWLASAAMSLIRLRWKTLAVLAGLTLLASVIIAAAWLRFDSRVHAGSRALRPLGLVPGPLAGGLRRGSNDACRVDAAANISMAEAAPTVRDREPLTDSGATMEPTPRSARPGRNALRAATWIVAAAALLDVAGLAAWWGYTTWRLGRVELTNDGPPLTVQVLDASDDTAIGEPIELVTRAMLALPDGDYRLRVTGSGRLGRIIRLAVNRGESVIQPLTLDDSRLLGEAPVQPMGGQEPPRKEPIALAPDTVATRADARQVRLHRVVEHHVEPAGRRDRPDRLGRPRGPETRQAAACVSSLAALVRGPVAGSPARQSGPGRQRRRHP